MDSSKNDSDSSGATGADRKERETIVRYDVHDKSNDTELDATESWALPRRERKECVIQEVGGQAEAAVKAGSSTRRSREEKRASRQARLKKCIAMVDGEKDAVGSAVPSDALESCGESDVVKSEESEAGSTESTEAKQDPVLSKDALEAASKAHCATAVQEVGKQSWSKWKRELDQAEEQLVPDLPEDSLKAMTVEAECEVVDLDELD